MQRNSQYTRIQILGAWNNVQQALRAIPPKTLYGSALYSQRKTAATQAIAQSQQAFSKAIPSAQSNQMPSAAPPRKTTSTYAPEAAPIHVNAGW